MKVTKIGEGEGRRVSANTGSLITSESFFFSFLLLVCCVRNQTELYFQQQFLLDVSSELALPSKIKVKKAEMKAVPKSTSC